MDSPKLGKGKKGLISKTWERCKSFSGRKGSSGNLQAPIKVMNKSKSWPCGLKVNTDSDHEKKKGLKSSNRVVPEGCFSIYVGPERQKFVIKTEYVNHPLFKTLLEEAESEFGYSCEGPLMLPCEVDHFIKVLMEVDCEEIGRQKGCKFVARSHSSYHLLTPPRMITMNSNVYY